MFWGFATRLSPNGNHHLIERLLLDGIDVYDLLGKVLGFLTVEVLLLFYRMSSLVYCVYKLACIYMFCVDNLRFVLVVIVKGRERQEIEVGEWLLVLERFEYFIFIFDLDAFEASICVGGKRYLFVHGGRCLVFSLIL